MTAPDWMFACDVPGCSTRFAAHEELRGGGEPARLEARQRANGEGWHCDATIDLCPEHNAVKVPRETCWRAECRTGCYPEAGGFVATCLCRWVRWFESAADARAGRQAHEKKCKGEPVAKAKPAASGPRSKSAWDDRADATWIDKL